jgi:hypothetical protein
VAGRDCWFGAFGKVVDGADCIKQRGRKPMGKVVNSDQALKLAGVTGRVLGKLKSE